MGIEDQLIDAEEVQAALRNLMAVINRDGGHWAARFETDEKAAADAQDKVSGMFAKIEQLRADIELLEQSHYVEDLESRIGSARDDLEWCCRDMNFKAPEQQMNYRDRIKSALLALSIPNTKGGVG